MKNKMIPDVEWRKSKFTTDVTFSRYTYNFINVESDLQLEDSLLIKERNMFWGHSLYYELDPKKVEPSRLETKNRQLFQKNLNYRPRKKVKTPH